VTPRIEVTPSKAMLSVRMYLAQSDRRLCAQESWRRPEPRWAQKSRYRQGLQFPRVLKLRKPVFEPEEPAAAPMPPDSPADHQADQGMLATLRGRRKSRPRAMSRVLSKRRKPFSSKESTSSVTVTKSTAVAFHVGLDYFNSLAGL